MISTEFDYSECRYNPRSKGFVAEIEKGIPQFANYESHDGEERNNLFAYVVALYDKNSPLWASVPDYFQRKIKAAQTCNLPKSTTGTGGFAQWVREMLESKNKDVNKLIVSYLADLGDMDYMMLVSEIAMYHNVTQEMMGVATAPALYKTSLELSENIEKRRSIIIGSGDKDEHQRIRVALWESAEKDRRKLNPEAVVKMLDEEGSFPPDWSPYGKGYEIEDLKYHIEEDEH